ncbi:Hypothetical predicted protein, partial [Pelobates cultripes]
HAKVIIMSLYHSGTNDPPPGHESSSIGSHGVRYQPSRYVRQISWKRDLDKLGDWAGLEI